MFDFDPDDLIEKIEEQENHDTNDLIEDEINYDPDDLIDDVKKGEVETEVDDNVVEKAIIVGTIFGMGVEEGQNEAKREEVYPKGERSPEAVSLRGSEKSAGKKELRPFEQWVDDVIHGRKTLDDDL